MAIKAFETRESLKQKLKNRNLIFNDKELEHILVTHNYFNLFNGLETIFLESTSPKRYSKIKLQDFLNLYEFDKEITSILSNCIDTVEEQLKSSISYHFCKRHCGTLCDTMQYTNKMHYMNPANNIPGTPTYCRYSNTYPFKSNQNSKIFSEFNNFLLFKPWFLSNLVNSHDHINSSFYQDSSYSPPVNVAIYQDTSGVLHPDVAVPFWVAIETLTFGELLRLLHYLQDDVLEDVLKDFNLPLSKRTIFLNMIDFLLCLRNNCAHTTLINRFRTGEKYKINNLLISSFSLSPKNTATPASVLKLYDVIKILSFFTDVSILLKPLKKLICKNYLSMGIRKGQKINSKILDRMGCAEYNKWKKMLMGIKYSL